MGIFFEQLLNGLTIGSFYALMALGYSMVYGVMKLINFAHGDLFAFGSYVGYTILIWGSGRITQIFGIWGGMAVTLLITFITVAIAGILVEKAAYRPVYPAGRLPLVVSALGMSIFIQNGIMAVWGPRFQAYPSEVVPSAAFDFFGIHITLLKVFILFFSFFLMAVIYYIVEKTTFGAAVRAAALDRETATMLGIDIRKVIFFVFALGPALGGMAGVMNGMYYRSIQFNMGWNYGLKAFTATILGGIGNIPGAMIGGLLLGIMESLFAGYFPSGGAWKDGFIFIVLILVLIWRPTGLIGEKIAEKV
ncbi:branched-chain amino acid ABC transporter permease [Atribacter sp.]|uniref:branched-chain amino acid ABC transporter permease n=1 Tax=Atribacter sp. TaxID=2847780 RepID=UPI00345E6129